MRIFRKANLARFINHCCEPNCEMQKWYVGNKQCVALFAKYFIPSGECSPISPLLALPPSAPDVLPCRK
eukprot:765163-Hanusia_phi.AAC.2